MMAEVRSLSWSPALGVGQLPYSGSWLAGALRKCPGERVGGVSGAHLFSWAGVS